MSSESGRFEPGSIELEMLDFWERGDYFHADEHSDKPPYSIVIPPPNVTGALHLGHAINNTLQDALIRRKRMQGYNACWLPGTDHAGIATQAVVERRLKQEQNLSRHDLGRAGLVAKIQEWKDEYEQRILGQLRRMGCSCDWPRTRFTLDEICAKAVYEAFFQFFKAGLIFRGKRLVNWDTQLQTAVADDEVYHETVRGHLWHVRYPVAPETTPGNVGVSPASGSVGVSPAQTEFLVVATTRPETMLADVAVAVHPDDPRYQHLIGRLVELPLTGRTIPVIADGILVKPEFGTGVVKVTPGHDPNDYECGLRHGLPLLDMMTGDGKVALDVGGKYAGTSLEAARKQIVADLEAAGLLEKTEPYETEVGHSDRSKTPIQPKLSEQWFLKTSSPLLGGRAMDAVRDGRITFYPERFAKSYLDWLSEKRDWCISRQLWWGHRIPVWSRRVTLASKMDVDREVLSHEFEQVLAGEYPDAVGRIVHTATGRTWSRAGGTFAEFVLKNPGEYTLEACSTNAERMNGWSGFEHDPDVLDTWFSSALWPFSTFGWPGAADGGAGETPTVPGQSRAGGTPTLPGSALASFFPTNVLSTGRDIITLWVARMAMDSLYFTGRAPFQHVLIHPTIQDGQGRRMSKSAGNGVDPLDIVELYGADALRYTLAGLAGDTQDVRFPVKAQELPDGRTINTSERFEDGQRFCNKLWQVATGFVFPNLGGAARELPAASPAQLALEDRWILSRLSECIAKFDERLDGYRFAEAVDGLYSFMWNDFCDWYVELVKPRLYGSGEAGDDAGQTGDAPGRPSSAGAGAAELLARVTHALDDDAARASADAARRVLAWVLDQTLRLLHPIAPFITEKLWGQLNALAPQRGLGQLGGPEGGAHWHQASGDAARDALCIAAWPTAELWEREPGIEREMAVTQDVIRALRDTLARVNALRSQAKEKAIRTLPRALVRCGGDVAAQLRGHLPMLRRLGRTDEIDIGPDVAKPPQSASQVLTGIEVYVPLTGLADPAIEIARLSKERDETARYIGQLDGKLSKPGFADRAPADVVQRERDRLAELQGRLAAIERNLAELAG